MSNNDDDRDGGNLGQKFVPFLLCAESRAHMETKIDNMETNIKNAIHASISTVKLVVVVAGFLLACLQLAIHIWG